MKRLLLLFVLLSAGCGAAHVRPPAQPAGGPPASSAVPHENLNAVLWMQTAVEYEATALQAYWLAGQQLDAALKDQWWTAAIEQTGDFSRLPPAVILDIDETVLDNSYFQARRVRDGTTFTPEIWDAWCEEARATAIPGALAFTRHASRRGVTVFYISNRTSNVRTATRANLEGLGFPVAADEETILLRGDRPGWHEKTLRRAHVAERYRVLLLVGDDLGDFVADPSGAPEARAARTAAYADWWGRRWIVLPNPTYGSWERAVIGSSRDPVRTRREALQFEPAPEAAGVP